MSQTDEIIVSPTLLEAVGVPKCQKTCSCGKQFEFVPDGARFLYDSEGNGLTGWYWNCPCKSTLFYPVRLS